MVQKTKVNNDLNGHFFERIDSEEDGIASTGSYVAVLKIDATFGTQGLVVVKNVGGATMFYKVLGSNKATLPANDSDASWVEIKAETSLAATTGVATEKWTDPYKWVWVEVKDNAGNGTFKGWSRVVKN